MEAAPDVIFATNQRESQVGEFLNFVLDARTAIKDRLVSTNDPQVRAMRAPVEDHYIDDDGKNAMYQRIESALYDDSRSMVTLWRFFGSYDRTQLQSFRRLLDLELEGLSGDRHPRKVFDRSPFGIAAIVIGTITIWMSLIRTFTGEDLGELLELIRFNWLSGLIWIVGLFVVLWYILKTHRNNQQVAVLSSLKRALNLYLD